MTARADIIDHESERFVIYATMCVYLVLSILCLRCMNGFAVELAAGPRASFLDHLTDELIYRKELYARANRGTTILTAIKKAASKDTKVTFSKEGKGAEGADVGVVVIGEEPYAEMKGDRADLSLAKEDKEAVAAVKKAGVPVVVVLLSGRPLILGDVLNQADAIVAAWLPGSEGDGVADILFGDAKPTGKLSRSWPRSMSQIPITINSDGDKYDPLFKYGYGLSYGD